MDTLTQLQTLLRELFQLDLADLDFGMYRLLRLKSKEVESFLAEQLPRRVEEAFRSVVGGETAVLENEIAELARRVREQVADYAIADNGEVNPPYRETNVRVARQLLDDYQDRRRRLQSVQASEAQKAQVFNHLYAFFSRYYEAGDFMPQRRRGARETYAVPYNGEETFFHWANRGQHYVKTGEAFRDYGFTVDTLAGQFRVRFSVTQASLPDGNTKGDTRYFFPLPDHIAWDAGSRTLSLPFHYRLPTAEEVERHGKNSKLQEGILQAAVPAIIGAIPDATLATALSVTVEQREDQEVSLLLKRLRHFARRSTTDYFVHRHLEGFLKQELEFYLKDQVLHVADIEGDLEAKRCTLRVIRQLADEIIAFLSQIEDAQKRLFEKRKLVLRTDYLAPIKEVPRDLWREVLDNQAQVEAWKTLFAVEPKRDLFNHTGQVDERFLEEHPTLVVNTAHFGPEFKERLLAAFDDIDEATDGLLIHSENYQALRLLERKYAGRVKCIYIDPPYNTGSDDFIYKDRYRHSSWLAMMEERLRLAQGLLAEDGAIFVSIDDNEQVNLKKLLDELHGPENFVATVIWQKVFSPKSTARHFSEDHDYILAAAKSTVQWQPCLLPRTSDANARYGNPDNDPRGDWTSGDLTARNYYGEGQYEVESPSGRTFRPAMGTYWRVSHDKFLDLDRDNRIWWGPSGDNMPRLKRFLSEVKQGIVPQTLWPYSEVGHTQEAKQELLDVVRFKRTEDVLNTVKPTRLIRRVLQVGTDADAEETVVDFFAGSGTTGHAVIRQNREDGGRRRFILVEMGQYFDALVLQRISRAMYTPEWADLKPKRLPTREEVERTPRLVKVLRLESYEDALHNLTTDETLKREEPRADAHRDRLGEDAYRLSYLVRLPLETSATMLNLAALEHPFDYKLEVLTEDGPHVQTVDLVETFNFLYGLHVERLKTWTNDEDGRKYRVVKGRRPDGKRVLVLWRDVAGLDPIVERRFLEARLEAEGLLDEVLVNADAATSGARSLDGLFKRLLEEGEQ